MTGSLGGVLVLFGVGAAFVIAGALGAVARRVGGPGWSPGRLAIGVDLFVGAAAIVEAVIGVAEVSPRALLWLPASVVLAVAVVLLVLSRVLWTAPVAAPPIAPAPGPARSTIGSAR